MQINVSYITANEIMEILGVGRSKAYEIVRVMNEELEQAGYNIIKGKVPVRYFQKKYYGCETSIEWIFSRQWKNPLLWGRLLIGMDLK